MSSKRKEEKLLEYARKCAGASIKDIVKDGNVDLNAKDETGFTAVHWSCKAADISSVSILLDNGANPDLLDANGLAPIHHAAQRKFTETMATLVSHGADINIQTAKSKMTALHFSANVQDKKAIKLLLFNGADPSIKDENNKIADIKMPCDTLMEAKCLSDAIKSRHSYVAGRLLNPNECHRFSKLGLQLRNSSNYKNLYFFCRKILLEDFICVNYLDVCRLSPIVVGRQAEIISDIYYYLVNVTVNDVQVTVPVYEDATEFDNVFIVDNSGHTFNCSPVQENKQRACRATMTFQMSEDNIYCFAVFVETKKDTFTITDGNQKFQSSVDNRYMVKLPNGCCTIGSSITMQVHSTLEYVNNLDSKYVMTASNFCAMGLSNKNTKPFTLTLSLPLGYMKNDSLLDVVVYHAASTQQTPTGWKEMASKINVTANCVTVIDKSITSGTCIVTQVPKNRTSEFQNGLKEFLCYLFKAILSRKRPCHFYAVLKGQLPADEYQIYVGLVEKSRLTKIPRTWTMEQYDNSCNNSGEYLIRSSSKFSISLNVSSGSIIGATNLNLIYHYKSKVFQEFRVKCKGNGTVTVSISECQAIDSRDYNENQIRTQIFLQLCPDVKPKQTRQFTEFPDNKYLIRLATEIGHQWMMLGIGLGFSYGSLELFEQNNKPSDASFMMLLNWRDNCNAQDDIGIAMLLRTLQTLDRQDIIRKVNQKIQKLLTQKPDERICKWIQALSKVDGLDSVDGPAAHSSADRPDSGICVTCMIKPDKAPSPFSHKFLLTVVHIVGYNLPLIQLFGFKEVEEVRTMVRDQKATMFKCLVLVQRQYHNLTKFVEDLLNNLHLQNLNDAILQIREECLKWLESSDCKSNEIKRNIGKVLDDAKEKTLKRK